MINRSSRYYLLRGIVVSVLALAFLLSYAVTSSYMRIPKNDNEELRYVSYEVLTDNILPVAKEEEIVDNNYIVRPYTSKNVEIGKNYYDYKAEETNQENSIIYYENTYIQNTGIDYVSKEVFNVNAIADGKVISVTQNDIIGMSVKIKHSNDMISVYQSLKDVKVKENDDVVQGQIIATSGTNSISSELGNHLHFELYNQNILVNPEKYFTEVKGD